MATTSDSYCPEAGDFIWIDPDPTVAHEQSGRRPAIVLSPHNDNAAAGLCVICPITSRVRDYSFEAMLPDGASFRGVVLGRPTAQHLLEKTTDQACRASA